MTSVNYTWFEYNSPDIFIDKATQWAKQHDIFVRLDGNEFSNGFPTLLAINAKKRYTSLDEITFGTPLLGFIHYDVKNQIEELESTHQQEIDFPETLFFEPEILIYIQSQRIGIFCENPSKTFEEISRYEYLHETPSWNGDISLPSKPNYIDTISRLKKHLMDGDIYEINYCICPKASDVSIDPFLYYKKLIERSPMPFSSFVKYKDSYLMCASPERYIKKTQDKIITQPIKGTSKRHDNADDDTNSKELLASSIKERAENLMIVDLMRNDLAKISTVGSVRVDELFGIYSFKYVHQMISTISATLKDSITFKEIIQATFPMGSMTGAPKISAMKLIDQYESFNRSLFSGSVGYIEPNGDFDFNVVIRSALYDSISKKLLFPAGSAITFQAHAESEYEECILKIQAHIHLLKTLIDKID